MTARSFAILGLALVLAACGEQPEEGQAAPEAGATGTSAVAAPQTTEPNQATAPETPLPSSSTSVTVSPQPTECGAEKLQNYLNLLPTVTAKDEIAKTVGHNRIRYVGPDDVTTKEFRADRLTAALGVDGRIKEFRCG